MNGTQWNESFWEQLLWEQFEIEVISEKMVKKSQIQNEFQDQNETYGYECLYPCDFKPCNANDTCIDIRDSNGTMDLTNGTSGNETDLSQKRF